MAAAIAAAPSWARANLFNTWWSSAITLVLAYLIVRGGWAFIDWAFVHAVWSVPQTPTGPNTQVCRALQGVGACWAVVTEKYRFILFAFYPFAQQWRPAICVVLFIALYVVSAMRRFWRRELFLIWIAALVVIAVLMWGGVLGLPYVPQDQWGGLPLTLILATIGLAAAFPLAVLVALGRRSTSLPAVKMLCVLYVELIRGVPLISLLFMATTMFPLFMPSGVSIDKLLCAQVAIILFAAAYLAEVVRAGLHGAAAGTGGSRRCVGTQLLAQDWADRAAAGVALGYSPIGQHVHRIFQGYLPGADRGDFRSAEIRDHRGGRAGLAGLRQRNLRSAGDHLLCVLLRHVSLQPKSGAAA